MPHLSLANSGAFDHMISVLLDPGKPTSLRAQVFIDAIMSTLPDLAEARKLTARIFERLALAPEVAQAAELQAKCKLLLAELESGSIRTATLIGLADESIPGPKPRLLVVTPDGQERAPSVGQAVDIESLKTGMTVYLDAKGILALGVSKALPRTGSSARFIRRLPDADDVEIEFKGERRVVYAGHVLLEAEEEGRMKRGDRVLYCPNRAFAFVPLPEESDRRHRFIDQGRIPEVIAGRDIGRPHWILGWLVRRAGVLMFRPDLVERFRLRPKVSVALLGPSGTGKTLTIKAFLHELQKMIVRFTGRDDLGSRVIRVKTSDLLSPWFGQSDINIDELFNDILYLASQECELADGRRVSLPICVVIEEFEGIAQRRGNFDGGVYDRVIGMLLQRLDDPTDELSKYPIFLISTSNRPETADAAAVRRLMGICAYFRRLDREGMASVLAKKLPEDLPYASHNGASAEQLRREVIDQIVAWTFSPNSNDRGEVQITFRDGNKAVKYVRDFLTGSVIEQTVANAIDRVVFASQEDGGTTTGLSAEVIMDSLCEVVSAMADNLTAANAGDYVDLPEQAAVASVQRLRGPKGRNGHYAGSSH